MKSTVRQRFMFIVFIGLLLTPNAFCVYAEQSSVVNSISVRSKSGGNSVQGGTMTEGTSVQSVDIVTTINGEIVEDIHEMSTGSEPLVIQRSTISTTSHATVETHVERASEQPQPVVEQRVHIETTTPHVQAVSTEEDETRDITNVTEDTSSGTTTTETEPATRHLVTWAIASVARVIAYVFTLFS